MSKWLWPAESENVPAAALLGLTLDTTATITAHQAEQILNSGYQRGNFVLAQPVGLDDWQKVAELENETRTYMRSAAWQRVCDWVKVYWH
ncbi:hypothetical protein [Burkholderia stagnalis]|uniref:hypothetical protein n=1 Tax=Burkholderia stagnalis TaxID=1503054 RepID=UPI001F499174|nr:hypothetical protein [Burkholderia stagnalis]